MTTSSFWTDGPDEHRRAVEKHIEVLQQRLKSCDPEDREQLSSELDQALEELKKSDNPRIDW